MWGTGGVAVSTPESPAEKQEADFRAGEPGAKCLGASCHRAEKCRRCRPGAALAERQRGEAQNGRARRAWVDSDGVLRRSDLAPADG
ncbi:hypothetical protein MOKP64_15780 [Mycobacterium avium subsp. hominissuis]